MTNVLEGIRVIEVDNWGFAPSAGTVLADWVARAADGSERGRGTNVFAMDRHGRIESVTGFWNPPKQS